MTGRGHVRRALLPAAIALALALTGCVSLPDEGGVRSVPRPDQESERESPFDYTPSSPRKGAGQAEIVDGFLQAMTATPVTTQYARKFLAASAANAWLPDKGTLVYGSQASEIAGGSVTLALGDTVRLGGRGEWIGNAGGGKDVRYQLDLVQERGEWRVSNPPNLMMVPQTHFESRFQQYFLHFFDKSAQILVPEPVYLPRGDTLPTMLVRGLLRGPDQHLLGAERTFLPAGTELEISVPVQPGGTAEVPLSDEILDLDGEDLDRALAQLAWTLRQVSGIERMRVTVDGSPMDIPGRGTEQDLAAWPEYDPAVNWASQDLFGIRAGRVVNLVGDSELRVSGLFGSRNYGLRSVAVDLSAEKVAGVSADGRTVLVADRSMSAAEAPEDSRPDTVYSGGTDLLKPAWDLHGLTWLVDRGAGGAVLSVVRGGVASEVFAPGVTGEGISSFAISRDGTRLVAAVDGAGSDRLVVGRIMRKDDGSVRRVSPATDLPVGEIRVDEIRDLSWRTPGSVALLVGPMPGVSQVIIALIDGSFVLGDVAPNAEVFPADAVRIVTAPTPGSLLFVGTRNGQVLQLASNGRWTGTSIEGGLKSPTYVG